MPMVRSETAENHRMYCLMLSDNFVGKKSGTQVGIEPTTCGVPTTALTTELLCGLHPLPQAHLHVVLDERIHER